MKKNNIILLVILLILSASVTVYAQNIKVSGIVIGSEDNLPIPGATVLVKGTSTGTVTDNKGTFEINAPADATLVISFIGYRQFEFQATSSHVTVTLEPDNIMIDEVVVTALGIKRSEKALGYSAQRVSGDNLQKVAVVDVTTSLTGKVAGMLVKNPTDFNVSPELTIRGEKPLLVIDGIAYENKTLNDLASEDIESISVLKGATASALYGFRGGSGAIVITTRNGTGTRGLSVDISTNTMFTAGYLAIPEKQSVYGRGINGVYDKSSIYSWGEKMDGRILLQWDPILKEYREYAYLPIGKDNFKNFLEQGYITSNNVNVSYGGEIASVRSSLNWTENKARYPNQKLNKFTYSFGGDLKYKNFELSSNLAYTKRTSPNMGYNGYTSYDPMYGLIIWSSADFDIRDYKDNYWKKYNETQNYSYYDTEEGLNNPYFDAYEKTNTVSRDIFNADLTTSYQITSWLKATARTGLDFFTDRGELKVNWGSNVMTGNTGVPGNMYTWNGYLKGSYDIGQEQGYSINSDFFLTGDKSFDKLNIEYLAGGTIFYMKDDILNARTQEGISTPKFYAIAASIGMPKVVQSALAQQVNSLYGRFAVSWDKFVFLDLTGRNDWSSTQHPSKRSYFYPSVSGSFVLSELMPSTKSWLDLLKVRASWTMSKMPAEIYKINYTFKTDPLFWGTLNGAEAPNSLYSPFVSPETHRTIETGLQFIMFRNRLSFDASYYSKFMYQRLVKASLSSATGYDEVYINIGEDHTRRGWEIYLGGTPILNKGWKWDLGFNWTKFATYYSSLDDQFSQKKPWVRIGQRVDPYISKDYNRDPSGNIIHDNAGLPEFSNYDSRFGFIDPDWIWGLSSTLKYKNLSLFVSVDGVVGGLMGTRTESYMWQAGVHPESVQDREKEYTGQGVKVISGTVTYDKDGFITSDTRKFAPNDNKTSYESYMRSFHGSSAWGGNGTRSDVYSKTFFKFRELSLTYNIPAKYLKTWWCRAASAGIVGQNLFLWSEDFKYSDPDGGNEDFADPSVRYLGFNIKLSF